MKATISLFALLAACGQQPGTVTADDPQAAGNEMPASKPAEPAPVAFSFDDENDLFDFHFGWSAEAAAVPQLVARFQQEMAKAKAELVKMAQDEKTSRAKLGWEYHGLMFSTGFETAGQSNGLLSLRKDVGSYTGGAHGNSGTAALLWDRQEGKEIKDTDLFVEAANRDRLLTQRWCDALNKAREEKRGEPVGGNGMFDDCPKLAEIAIIPTDTEGNGRFERIMLVASPYVAGPFSEGSYEVELGVTHDLLAALKSEYRSSFEISQTQ